jgi:uncharacterized LabA/DUF88 family protein
MYFGPNAKIALFIDGHYLYSASRNLGFEVDYRNLLELFRKQGSLIRAYYYVAVLESDEYSPVKPLTDWLAYNGYSLVMKPAKEHTDAEGRRRVKGNMEVEITCDMLEMGSRADHMVLFSGNADLTEAVNRAQRQARVLVVSTIKAPSTASTVSDELRRQADEFVELAAIAPEFTRNRRDVIRTAPAAPAIVTPANPFGEAEVVKRRRATA